MKPSLPPQSKHIKAGMDSAAANKPQEATAAPSRGASVADNVSLIRHNLRHSDSAGRLLLAAFALLWWLDGSYSSKRSLCRGPLVRSERTSYKLIFMRRSKPPRRSSQLPSS